jgi:hypothetical protein
MLTFHGSSESDLNHGSAYMQRLDSVECPYPEQILIEFGHQCTLNTKKNDIHVMPNVQIPRKPTRSQDTRSYQVISRFREIASHTQTCSFALHHNQNEFLETEAKLRPSRKPEEIRNECTRQQLHWM